MKKSNYLFLILICILHSCTKKEVIINKSSANNILEFNINSITPKVTAVIDSVKKTISISLPEGTDVRKLIPTIIISEKATISPNSETSQDFSKPVIYTIIAENGNTQVYTVIVYTVIDIIDIEVGDNNYWGFTQKPSGEYIDGPFYFFKSNGDTGNFVFDYKQNGSYELKIFPNKEKLKPRYSNSLFEPNLVTSNETIYAVIRKYDNSPIFSIERKQFQKIKVLFKNNTFGFTSDDFGKQIDILTKGISGNFSPNSQNYLFINDRIIELK